MIAEPWVIKGPEVFKACLIAAAEALGFASRITAMAADTCAVAIEVPLSLAKLLMGKLEELIPTPGANKSNAELRLLAALGLSALLVAATEITCEMQAGELIAVLLPLLPDDATMLMPAEVKLAATGSRGSASQFP